ncbi:MAG: anthranilate synthase component I family protein [Fulvivirga sp.]|uniref:anthranilate synthase component I family protein n=1 Tax=Fulvivirga sp. TaxID=1931237 RepID=UPI0032EC6FD2
MKSSIELQLSNVQQKVLINKALAWALNFDYFTYFNPNNYTFPNEPFEHMLLVGNSKIEAPAGSTFDFLHKHLQKEQLLAGHFSYDLKNEIETLVSNNKSIISSENASFFTASTAIYLNGQTIRIESEKNPNEVLNQIELTIADKYQQDSINFESLVSKDEYLRTANRLIEHIIEGDIYEINYCIPFIARNCQLNPTAIYQLLCEKYPSPFSVLYKNNNQFIISGSPERFLKREGDKLISQPIKGTSKRGKTKEEDLQLKTKLRSNEKELAENMMIVDLVRNDLAKSCKPGSVKVEEMFGIYTFPLWHQMISTVTGDLKHEVNACEAIKNAFPMGSMTGAPKIKVMELIEKYEITKRGIYSGAIGYFKPNGDFDFNVVIRSLIYDQSTTTCTFHVGSAITFDSDPEAEYEECLLKAKTLTSLF